MARKISPPTASTPSLEVCPHCQEFVGRSYPHCAACREIVEEPIKAAWLALLHAQESTATPLSEQTLAAHVLAQSEEYWWSEVEAAMRFTSCPSCHGPLGYGSPDCQECIWSSDLLWGKDLEVTSERTIRRNAWIKAGRGRELAHCHSIEQMYAITQRGRK